MFYARQDLGRDVEMVCAVLRTLSSQLVLASSDFNDRVLGVELSRTRNKKCGLQFFFRK